MAAIAWLLGHETIAIVAVSLGSVMALLAVFAPAVHHQISRALSALARYAGALVSLLVSLSLFVAIILPLGILRRLTRSRRIPRGADSKLHTYWVVGRRPERRYLAWQFSMGPTWTRRRSVVGLLVLVPLAFIGINFCVGIALQAMHQEQWPSWYRDRESLATKQTPQYDELLAERARAANVFVTTALGSLFADFDGKLLTIKDGERVSYVPSSLPDEPAIEVYFFGGSTVWGYGQRNEYTIASEYARAAEAAGLRVHVHNFGITGWVNFNEVARFTQLLSAGYVPHMAIFYTGANDGVAISGTPTVEMIQPLVTQKVPFPISIEEPGPPDWRPLSAFHILGKHWDNLSRVRSSPRKPDRDDRGFMAFPEVELPKAWIKANDASAAQAVDILHGNLDVARLLAEKRGVVMRAFLQPTMYTRKLRADEIYGRYLHDKDPQISAYLMRLHRRIAESVDPARIEPLLDALDDMDVPPSLDWVHLNEAGARRMGQLLFERTESNLRETRAKLLAQDDAP